MRLMYRHVEASRAPISFLAFTLNDACLDLGLWECVRGDKNANGAANFGEVHSCNLGEHFCNVVRS